MTPLRLEDPFAYLCKRHRRGEIYKAASLSDPITDLACQIHLGTEFPDWLTINKQKKGTYFLEIGQRPHSRNPFDRVTHKSLTYSTKGQLYMTQTLYRPPQEITS